MPSLLLMERQISRRELITFPIRLRVISRLMHYQEQFLAPLLDGELAKFTNSGVGLAEKTLVGLGVMANFGPMLIPQPTSNPSSPSNVNLPAPRKSKPVNPDPFSNSSCNSPGTSCVPDPIDVHGSRPASTLPPLPENAIGQVVCSPGICNLIILGNWGGNDQVLHMMDRTDGAASWDGTIFESPGGPHSCGIICSGRPPVNN